MSFKDDINSCLADIRATHEADVLLYAGLINRRGADDVLRALSGREHKNLIMLLCTNACSWSRRGAGADAQTYQGRFQR